MTKKFYLTKKGFERIKKEYKVLKKLLKAKIKGDDVPFVFESDDVNVEFLAFQDNIEFLETRLAELETILNNAEVISFIPKEKRNIVQIGAIVTLEEQDGRINEFMLVESLEADVDEGKISVDSPFGKELLGKKIGETVQITTPGSFKIFNKIKKIRYNLS
ncbi:MAG: GreA/GreB family elongation factor [Minisyncoccales bacterium]